MPDFNEISSKMHEKAGYKDPLAFGIARVLKNMKGESIKVDFAVVNYKNSFASAAVILHALEKNGAKLDFNSPEAVYELHGGVLNDALEPFSSLFGELDKHANVKALKCAKNAAKVDYTLDYSHSFEAVFLYDDAKPASVESVYLKLYLLSKNFVKPREICLDGAFGILPNLAWDERGEPYELEWLREHEIELKMEGKYPNIAFIDKFPRMLSHIIPADNATRVLDSAKVRLGAHLAPGTVVMPGASYINFNAGTLGSVMVEGRISSSVRVGAGSDVGGGASILGVLSGTNGNPISVGEKCLLGANSTTGVPLGDGCIVDAGLAILEGTKVFISADNRKKLAQINKDFSFDKEIYKARELSGLNGLHFRQDSRSGQITAALSTRAIKLNESLH